MKGKMYFNKHLDKCSDYVILICKPNYHLLMEYKAQFFFKKSKLMYPTVGQLVIY